MDKADAPEPALHHFFEMAGLKFDPPPRDAPGVPEEEEQPPATVKAGARSPRRPRTKRVSKPVTGGRDAGALQAATATAEKTPAVRYDPRIPDMPSSERPRERLIQHGSEVLNTAELLAILLRTGTEQRSALGLAEHLLSEYDGLRGVARMTVEEMSKVSGIGPAKAAQIKAAIEFGRRLVAASPEERPRITSPRDVYNLIGPSLRDEKREHFVALLLDTKNGVLRQRTISIGDLSSSIVHPLDVFSAAVRHSAASLIVAHNHPSGDPTPAPEDAAVTRRLVEAGEVMGIEVLDHIVIGDNRWVSLREKGLM